MNDETIFLSYAALMNPNVKICGLTRPEDVEAAILCGADLLGFIVEAKSARRLSIEQAARLSRPAKGVVPSVAVTVNADNKLLARIVEVMQPDYIQLHGDETPQRVQEISDKFGVKLIKALPVSTPEDLYLIAKYKVEFPLLDAKPPKGAPRGGHGATFDWAILKSAALPPIWALAGGLTPENAARAAKMTNAPILDVSSGVEAAAGIKDAFKLKSLIDAVKHGQAR